MRLVELAHELVAPALASGDLAIDATCGNGLDTLFLASKVGPAGRVYSFDIQPQAIETTRARLIREGLIKRVHLVLGTHSKLDFALQPEAAGKIKAVMFNLGYLPGGDKTIITRAQSTLIALEKASSLLSARGRISVLCYTAHTGGQLETERINAWLDGLPEDFAITRYRPERRLQSPPELIILERLKDSSSTSPNRS